MKPYGQERSWVETDQERKHTRTRKGRKLKGDPVKGKWKSRERQKAKKEADKALEE